MTTARNLPVGHSLGAFLSVENSRGSDRILRMVIRLGQAVSRLWMEGRRNNLAYNIVVRADWPPYVARVTLEHFR